MGIIGADGIDGIRGKGEVLGDGLVVRALSLVGVLGESEHQAHVFVMPK